MSVKDRGEWKWLVETAVLDHRGGRKRKEKKRICIEASLKRDRPGNKRSTTDIINCQSNTR